MTNEYTYDQNGNLTKDLNKNITSITYHELNLPQGITLTVDRSVTYGYDAAGRKLDVAYRSGGTTVKTEYAGNNIYKNGTLSMLLTEEGSIAFSGTVPTYHCYLKDHQGNIAVVAADVAIDVNAKGEIQTIGGVIGENKSITNAAIDAVSSVVPGKVVDNVTSGFNKAVSSDLGSSAAATLTKETKSSLKQAQATVNSTAVQTGANAAASYAGGVVGGQANKVIGTGSTTRVSTPLKDSIVQPNDATRVQKPIFPIYP